MHGLFLPLFVASVLLTYVRMMSVDAVDARCLYHHVSVNGRHHFGTWFDTTFWSEVKQQCSYRLNSLQPQHWSCLQHQLQLHPHKWYLHCVLLQGWGGDQWWGPGGHNTDTTSHFNHTEVYPVGVPQLPTSPWWCLPLLCQCKWHRWRAVQWLVPLRVRWGLHVCMKWMHGAFILHLDAICSMSLLKGLCSYQRCRNCMGWFYLTYT